METTTLRSPTESRLQFVSSVVPQLKSTALELFGSVSVDFEVDPEIPNSHYLVVRVRASGEISDIAARRLEWYRRTQELLRENSDLVRLDIDAQ